MQEEFIKQKENTLCLVPYTKLNKKRNIGIYKFIPGASGLRAVFLARCTTHFNEHSFNTVNTFI